MARIGTAGLFVLAALIEIVPATLSADYPAFARPRDIVALRGDLDRLDESLGTLRPRERRDFRGAEDAIRRDVNQLKAQIERRGTYWRERTGVPRSEVIELRHRIALLRDDVERAQGRRQADALDLPIGTGIWVRLDQGVSSRSARTEERVEASVVEPVKRDGRTVIPAGTLVSGFVRDVQRAGRAQQGRLWIEFDSLSVGDGERADIRAEVVSVTDYRSDNSRKSVGLGALLGGIVGGIIDGRKGALVGAAVGAGGVLVATQGDDLELPEGTLFALRLERPTTIALR